MTHDEKQSAKLPLGALLALAMTGFICILTETLPAGLLPEIGRGLGVSASLTGQLVTVYALGSLLAAIPLTIATQRWRRRTVLLLTIVGFLVFNSVTALSSSYWLTLVARFFAGVSAGLAWSLIAGYARRMVTVQLQGRALAVADRLDTLLGCFSIGLIPKGSADPQGLRRAAIGTNAAAPAAPSSPSARSRANTTTICSIGETAALIRSVPRLRARRNTRFPRPLRCSRSGFSARSGGG